MPTRDSETKSVVDAPEAGNGLYSRRRFIQRSSATVVGAAGIASLSAAGTVLAEAPASWQRPGAPFTNYGQPLDGRLADRQQPIRWISNNSAVPGDGVSWTPLHDLAGMITPNGLHFERHHNGVPDIDPATWELSITGRVKRPMAFDLEALHRLPQQSRITVIECGGNSNSLWHPNPVQAAAGYLHGLVSCAEWSGVPLKLLIDMAGADPEASWIIADGLDSAGVTVSLPVADLPDDTLVALFQNGEALRAENGYPARLLVPGWEGIRNLKWLGRLALSDRPAMSRYDTVSYTELLSDGRARRFSLEVGVKSVITWPSPGHHLPEKGLYEIRGLAWSGSGAVEGVEVSADGGRSWVEAALQQPVMSKAFTPFRAAWRWDGGPAVLMSRARDTASVQQPSRRALLAEMGSNAYYHYNAVLSWAVSADGSLSHVYE